MVWSIWAELGKENLGKWEVFPPSIRFSWKTHLKSSNFDIITFTAFFNSFYMQTRGTGVTLNWSAIADFTDSVTFGRWLTFSETVHILLLKEAAQAGADA